MPFRSVSPSLSGRICACVSRVQLSIMCCHGSARTSSFMLCGRPGVGDTKRRSCWTHLLNSSTSLDVATAAGVGLRQVLQGLQVSTISGTILRADSGVPDACNIRCMRFAGLCHHLIWSILKVLRTTAGLCDLNSCSDLPRSNLDQSIPADSWVDESL